MQSVRAWSPRSLPPSADARKDPPGRTQASATIRSLVHWKAAMRELSWIFSLVPAASRYLQQGQGQVWVLTPASSSHQATGRTQCGSGDPYGVGAVAAPQRWGLGARNGAELHLLNICHFDQQLDAHRGWEIHCGEEEMAHVTLRGHRVVPHGVSPTSPYLCAQRDGSR